MPRDGTLLGALFESLVTLRVRTFARASEASVRHLRTQRGEHEVDLIVERDDGRVLAIEVKLKATIVDRGIRHLLWLRDQIHDDLLDAVIITTGANAYRRQDGVAVVRRHSWGRRDPRGSPRPPDPGTGPRRRSGHDRWRPTRPVRPGSQIGPSVPAVTGIRPVR